MSFLVRRWRPVAAPLLIALIVSTFPAPCSAGDASRPAAKPGLMASIDTAARALVPTQATPASRAAAQTGGEAQPRASKPFFKTPAGLVVLAVVAAGTGYAIYSSSHDRIPPQGR